MHLILIHNKMLLHLSFRWETNRSNELNTEERSLQAVHSTIFLLLIIRSLLNSIAQTAIPRWVSLQKQERCKFSAMMSTKLLDCLSTEGKYQASTWTGKMEVIDSLALLNLTLTSLLLTETLQKWAWINFKTRSIKATMKTKMAIIAKMYSPKLTVSMWLANLACKKRIFKGAARAIIKALLTSKILNKCMELQRIIGISNNLF